MKKTISLLLCAVLFCVCFCRAGAAPAAADVLACAEGIVAYKTGARGDADAGTLFAGGFLQSAGSTAGDWYPFGMAALGLEDDYAAYLATLRQNVRERYDADGTLSDSKATEWHRVLLAALSCGADPERFCLTEQGETVNLVNDGIFCRRNVGRQGLNGYIWALIALHTRDYPVPANAANTEETLLSALLTKQLSDGGWTMLENTADTDLTAMALIALAPMADRSPEAGAAADAAVECLAALQLPDGGFASGGFANCESCAVVLAALCTAGVDVDTDARFVKNGRTVYDALLSYRLADGSFTHAFISDPDDPAAVPEAPNDMSCQQALYALAAYHRFLTGGGSIFDFRASSLSDAGWDMLPEAPDAAERAAQTAAEKLQAFFDDQHNRKAAITALLAVIAALGILALCLRRKRRKRT